MSAIDDEIKHLLEGLKMESLLKTDDVEASISESAIPQSVLEESSLSTITDKVAENASDEPVTHVVEEPMAQVPSSMPEFSAAPETYLAKKTVWIGCGIAAAVITALSGWIYFQPANQISRERRVAVVEQQMHPGFNKQLASTPKKIPIGNRRGLVAFAAPVAEMNEYSLSRDAQEAFALYLTQLKQLLDNRQKVLERKSDEIDEAIQDRIQGEHNPLDSKLRRFQAADIILSYQIALFIQRSQENLVKEFAIPQEVLTSELLGLNASEFNSTIIEQVQAIDKSVHELKQTIERIRYATNLSTIADELLSGYQQIRQLEQNPIAVSLVDFENQRLRLQKACQRALDRLLQEQSGEHQRQISAEDLSAFSVLSTIAPGSSIDRWKSWLTAFQKSSRVRSHLTDQASDDGFYICENSLCPKAVLIEAVDQLANNRP